LTLIRLLISVDFCHPETLKVWINKQLNY